MNPRKLISFFLPGSGLALLLLGSSMAVAGDQLETPKLEALALNARTPEQHAAVSRRFRLRAEALDAAAATHEANVRTLTRSAGAMVRKWPGMATGALRTERRKALEARRAAAECRRLSREHLQLSVEALGRGR